MASEIGNADAQKVLGDYYMYGGTDKHNRINGSPIDTSEALKLYKKSCNSGNTDAKRSLAEYYCNQTSPDRNMEEGIRLYRELAEANDAESQYRLSEFYRYGDKMLLGALAWYTTKLYRSYYRCIHI